MNGSTNLLSVESVQWKDAPGGPQVGVLFVLSDAVEWVSASAELRRRHHLSAVKGQKVSPDGKKKVQLQLNLKDGSNMTFIFLSPVGQPKQQEERNAVKEMLQQLLPQFRNVAPPDAASSSPSSSKATNASPSESKEAKRRALDEKTKVKQKLLKEDKELFRLYQELVTKNILSSEEFWANVAEEKLRTEEESASNQRIGVAPGFLSDVVRMDGCNGIKLNLNADIIQSIFKTYPAVKSKHVKSVPHDLTEKEFWSKFFQSHYFHRDRSLNQSPADLFADCVKIDDTDMQMDAERAAGSSRLTDLVRLEDRSFINEEEEGAERRGNPANAALMRRFNYHSTRVLAASLNAKRHKAPEEPKASTSMGPPRRPLDSSELAEEAAAETALLTLRPSAAAAAQAHAEDHHIGPHDAQRYRDCLQDALQSTSDLAATELFDQAYFASCLVTLEDLSPGGRLVAKEWADLNASLPGGLGEELRLAASGLGELLRHFWGAFPANTPALEEKLARFWDTLHKFADARLKPLDAKLRSQYPQLHPVMKHLEDMLSRALEKLAAWKAKRKVDDGAKRPRVS